MNIQHNDFGIPEADQNLPSLATRTDYIMAQRDAAIALVEGAASKMREAYQQVMEAVAKANLVSKAEHSGYSYSHRDNQDYQNLFCSNFDPARAVEAFRKSVDTDIWRSLIAEAGVEGWMDAEAIKEFRAQLATDVPEVSAENLQATFETLLGNRRMMFLRGMANVFGKLDRRFKSHDAFEVKSRIIIDRIVGYSGGFDRHCHGAALLNDVDRCLRKIMGLPDAPGYLVGELDRLQGRHYGPKRLDFENDYVKCRIFQNGNAHVYFSKEAARRVNLTLAEYYGDVVPDAAPADMDAESFRSRHANLPAKDLAFYPTPDAAADKLVSAIYLQQGMRILEPSAGTGALIRALRRKIKEQSERRWESDRLFERDVTVHAVEIHPSRADQLRQQEGDFCTVTVDNFLSRDALPIYDAVIMNPPFHGTGYMDHVAKALESVKPGGQVIALLPISASIGQSPKHARFHRWLEAETRHHRWQDLPVGSFEESGTMINTTILTFRKPG